MFNHARTLLANLNAFNDVDSYYLAEELIDPSFNKIRLPGYLEAIRKVLFGVEPDRDMVNYRTRQLMTTAHATPLEYWVLDLDSRITYSTGEDNTLLANGLFEPVVTPVSDPTDPSLVIFGHPDAPDQMGKVARSYLVRVIDSDSVDVTQTGMSNLVFSFTMESGLSTPIPLFGSGYKFRLPVVGPGTEWVVQVRNRPQWDLGQLAAGIATIGEGVLENLFLGSEEPYLTFKNLWFKQDELPLKLGGVVLALIYRMEDLRNAPR